MCTRANTKSQRKKSHVFSSGAAVVEDVLPLKRSLLRKRFRVREGSTTLLAPASLLVFSPLELPVAKRDLLRKKRSRKLLLFVVVEVLAVVVLSAELKRQGYSLLRNMRGSY